MPAVLFANLLNDLTTEINALDERYFKNFELSHWDKVTHICVSKLTIIGSNKGLPPGRRQAII